MCSLCTIFVSMTCIVCISASLLSELLFEAHNSCGCFRPALCPNSYQPICSSQPNVLEGLYWQNTYSSTNEEVCTKWNLEGFTKNITAAKNGTLTVTLHFSSNLNYSESDLVVEILHLEQGNISIHSRNYLIFKETAKATCNKMFEVSFLYIFSGYYQLQIRNTNYKGCISKPFHVESSYKKALLTKPDFATVYRSQSQSLKYTLVDGISQPKNILVVLAYLNNGSDCTNAIVRAHLNHVNKGKCCHAITHESYPPRSMTYCPCEWDNNSTLLCNFRDIKNGNYCAYVEYIDPRCERNTLWTEHRNCVWLIKREVSGYTTTDLYEVKEGHKRTPLIQSILGAALASVSVLCVVSLFLITRWRGYPHDFYTETIEFPGKDTTEKSVEADNNEKRDILLLYPRDCEHFMKAMEFFRMILQASHTLKVYDPWDEEMFDEIVESIETWSLPLIKNENVRIIVVLSECSKAIEKAYIDGTCIRYVSPTLLDMVFGQSINTINQYFATRTDSYKRVFVVRLDDEKDMNLSFHFNCSTAYTIPHMLQILMDDLVNGYSKEMSQEHIDMLKASIKSYQHVKKSSSNYLNDTLIVEKQDKKSDIIV